jgi:hypothetical protein
VRAYFTERRRRHDPARADKPPAIHQDVGFDALAFDGLRRSTAFLQTLQMRRIGLFTEEEFARFSEQTRKQILDMEAM